MDGDDTKTNTTTRPLERLVAIGICKSGIGDAGKCVCARDNREPTMDIPRCAECLRAAHAAMAAIYDWQDNILHTIIEGDPP